VVLRKIVNAQMGRANARWEGRSVPQRRGQRGGFRVTIRRKYEVLDNVWMSVPSTQTKEE
jgi:hypothetical protein